jgi:hypothetical protein
MSSAAKKVPYAVAGALAVLVGAAGKVGADIPPHPHGPGWTTAERDGGFGVAPVVHAHPAPAGREEGNSAHQHYYVPVPGSPNIPFPGPAGGAGSQPFNVFGVWIQRQAFISVAPPFTTDAEYTTHRVGHSFIEAHERPRYKFVDAAMPQAAKDRVARAFELWGGIRAHYSPVSGVPLVTGIGFEETTGDNYEIEVRWRNITDAANGGCVHVRDVTPCGSIVAGDAGLQGRVFVQFDSTVDGVGGGDFNWDFTEDAAASDLAKFHFMSVALHELGHLMFLLHSPDQATDLMSPPVGLPLAAAVGSESFRWNSYLENADENDGFTGKKLERTALGVMSSDIFDHDSADAIKSLYSIPAPEPGGLVLLGLGVGGVVSYGWSRRRRT